MATPSPAVVVGVDGSPPAAEAARAAAREAGGRGLPLRLVRAFHWPTGDVAGLPAAYDACAASRRSAHADLERMRTGLADLLPASAVTTELVDGRPGSVLCRAAGAEDLLVVGASGLTWGAGDLLGSVAEAVAVTVGCPVLVHRSPSPLGPRRSGVVVGVDGSAGSAAVLATAATEAQLRGEPLRVVHAWRQLSEDAVQRLRWRLDEATSTSAETAAVEPLVVGLRSRRPALPVALDVAKGRAGQVLVQATATATLLVVGRRDVTAGGPGATVHSVLHRVGVPVLVVPVPSPVGPGLPERAAVAATGSREG
ncbi:universal stress protein [Modestobacter excelsi]|uniref:universal stress protein n=1 Tax=Modestobacter excelsi TaxID=2213161 RepID=UPI00110CB67F|nr:universal stress protein [Modestobacter excelsi]